MYVEITPNDLNKKKYIFIKVLMSLDKCLDGLHLYSPCQFVV